MERPDQARLDKGEGGVQCSGLSDGWTEALLLR